MHTYHIILGLAADLESERSLFTINGMWEPISLYYQCLVCAIDALEEPP